MPTVGLGAVVSSLKRQARLLLGLSMRRLATQKRTPGSGGFICTLDHRNVVDSGVCKVTQIPVLSCYRGIGARQTLIRNLRASFQQVVAAAGIIWLVPHQSRQTYATEMLRSGVTLTGVMELLGHTSPEITTSLYLEIILPDLQRDSSTPTVSAIASTKMLAELRRIDSAGSGTLAG